MSLRLKIAKPMLRWYNYCVIICKGENLFLFHMAHRHGLIQKTRDDKLYEVW